MQQTSIIAYLQLQPELSTRQEQIYKTLQKIGVATNKDLSNNTGLPINSITPRILELRKKGLVKAEYYTQQNGRTAIAWGIV